jgi:hypothetical protein
MTNNHNDFGGHQDGDKRSLGHTPKYREYHEVYITKKLGMNKEHEVIAFIGAHIAEFKGKTEEKHGIPVMVFERSADAHRFAKDLSAKIDIPREHIEVKAQKFTR